MDEDDYMFEDENADLGPKNSKKKSTDLVSVRTMIDDLIPDPKMEIASKSKLTVDFLKVMSSILDDQTQSAAWMTWDELVLVINMKLPIEERISIHTWKDWLKRADSQEGMPTNEVFEVFRQIIDIIRLKKKMNLINGIQNGKNVKGNAWLLSRSSQYRKEFGNEDKNKGGDTNIQINLMM